MRLRHIEVFHAVMVGGSLSAAARLLNMTQPAVSQTMNSLELQLGFALFQRVKGRLRPRPRRTRCTPKWKSSTASSMRSS